MTRVRLLFTYLGLLVCAVSGAQHTPLTSQYLFNGLLINPAYAGSRDALAANLTWRNQWVGFEGAPNTQVLSIHAPLSRRKLGLGVLVLNDHIGVSRQTGIFTNYAYRMKFRRSRLQFGLGAGATLMQADWTQVALQEQGDVVYATDSRNAIRPNFSAGAYYYNKKYFAGISMPFFLSHRFDPGSEQWYVSNQTRQYQPMITAGGLWKLNRELKIKPSFLLRYQLASGVQADVNCNLILKDKLWAGLSYRSGDAVVGMFEVLPTPQWRLGYAYDIGISSLNPYHGGSHELMVQYEFGYRIRVRDPHYF